MSPELVGVLVCDNVNAVVCEVELLACRDINVNVYQCAVLIENAVEVVCVNSIFKVSCVNVGNVICTHLF